MERGGSMSNSSFNNEQQLWEQWKQTKNKEVANELIQKFMPVVQYHVQRIAFTLPSSVPIDEIKSLALLGLYDAIEKYDYTRELKFETYASIRIRGAIIDGLRKDDYLSRGNREKVKKIEHAIEKIEQRLLRSPTIEEIAVEVKMDEDEVCAILAESAIGNLLSIDEVISDDSERKDSLVNILPNTQAQQPEESLIKNEMNEELARVIKEILNEKEQLVVSLYYLEELTFTEIATVLSLTTSRVSQIHSKAIAKLRDVLKKLN